MLIPAKLPTIAYATMVTMRLHQQAYVVHVIIHVRGVRELHPVVQYAMLQPIVYCSLVRVYALLPILMMVLINYVYNVQQTVSVVSVLTQANACNAQMAHIY